MDAYRPRLEKQGYQVLVARNGAEGIETIYQVLPDVVIAEIVLPEVNGYQICRLLKNDPVTKKIPVILVSDFQEKMDKFWGIKAGADMIMHHDELPAKLTKQVQILREMYDQIQADEKSQFGKRRNQKLFNLNARLNQILDKALIESTLMIEFRNLSDLIHDTGLLNYMLFSLLEGIVDYDAAGIFYHDRSKDARTVTFHVPEGKHQNTEEIETLKDLFFEDLASRYPDLKRFDRFEADIVGEVSEEAEPVTYKNTYRKDILDQGALIGSFTLYSQENIQYEKIFPVSLIEDEIRLLMRLRHIYSQAELLAIVDSLTGIYNYKHFIRSLDHEFKSSRRYEHPLSLALVKIDNFKEINDQYGHEVGDEILKFVSAQFDEHLRNVDVIARYSGKHLAVIFPKTQMGKAVKPLERLQKLVAKSPMAWKDDKIVISITIGLAAMEAEMENSMDLVLKAEKAMAKAEKQGGGCLHTLE